MYATCDIHFNPQPHIFLLKQALMLYQAVCEYCMDVKLTL